MNSGSRNMLKNSSRKEGKFDDDRACGGETIDSRLGSDELGSGNDSKRQAMREEQGRRSEAEERSSAGLVEVDEARRLLGFGFDDGVHMEEDEKLVWFAYDDDVDDLYTSLERAKKLAFHNQDYAGGSRPGAVASLAISSIRSTSKDDENSPENKVVFTEFGQFVWGLKLDEAPGVPERKDAFADEVEPRNASIEQTRDESGDRSRAKDGNRSWDTGYDGTMGEPAVGKGLCGVLKLLRERGTLKESVESCGKNTKTGMEKGELLGMAGDHKKKDGFKDIRIDTTDEFGRTVTEKEAFRLFCHRFHGKVPGKTKKEKRTRQFHEELKLKRMKNLVSSYSTQE